MGLYTFSLVFILRLFCCTDYTCLYWFSQLSGAKTGAYS